MKQELKKHEHKIRSVAPGSIAEELGVEPGDKLLEVNGNVVEDVLTIISSSMMKK